MFRALTRPRRVVITGMGCVTPLGIGREAFWDGLITGKSGVRRIQAFDLSSSPVQIAAEVPDFDWQAQLNPKDRKHVPRTVPLALAAAREALEDAKLFPNDLSLERAARDRCRARNWWRRPRFHRTAIRILVRWSNQQGKRLHDSCFDAWWSIERTVDGLWTAWSVAHRFDRLHQFNGRDGLRRAAHRARSTGRNALRWRRCADRSRHSGGVQSHDGVDERLERRTASCVATVLDAIDREWCSAKARGSTCLEELKHATERRRKSTPRSPAMAPLVMLIIAFDWPKTATNRHAR